MFPILSINNKISFPEINNEVISLFERNDFLVAVAKIIACNNNTNSNQVINKTIRQV
jgi:hypothetical protein